MKAFMATAGKINAFSGIGTFHTRNLIEKSRYFLSMDHLQEKIKLNKTVKLKIERMRCSTCVPHQRRYSSISKTNKTKVAT